MESELASAQLIPTSVTTSWVVWCRVPDCCTAPGCQCMCMYVLLRNAPQLHVHVHLSGHETQHSLSFKIYTLRIQLAKVPLPGHNYSAALPPLRRPTREASIPVPISNYKRSQTQTRSHVYPIPIPSIPSQRQNPSHNPTNPLEPRPRRSSVITPSKRQDTCQAKSRKDRAYSESPGNNHSRGSSKQKQQQ